MGDDGSGGHGDGQCSNVSKKDDPWPGLPAGIRFEPSDQELLGHLVAKVGMSSSPFIDRFIRTEDDVCCRHPEKLPGTCKDGSSAHYFHTFLNAYDIRERKRQKIQEGENKAACWKCVGGPQAISENGAHVGFKRTMVLVDKKGECKTNWVRHQYHLGTNEKEKEGELVVSKIVYEAQPAEAGDISRQQEAKSFKEACLASSQVLQDKKMALRDGFLKRAEVHDCFHTRLDKEERKLDKQILRTLLPSCSSNLQSREGHGPGLYQTMKESANSIFIELNPVPDSVASKTAEQGGGRNRSEAIRERDDVAPLHAHGDPGTHSTLDNGSNTEVSENPSRLEENETCSNDAVQEHSCIESLPMLMGDSLGPPPDYLLSTQEVEELEERLATNDDWGNTQ